MNQEFPHFSGNLSVYLGDLRGWVFQKQVQAANFFGVSHTTIGRYENGKLTPPIHYVVDLVKLVVERFQAASALSPTACQAVLQDINTIIQNVYPGQPFLNSWSDLWAFDVHYHNPAPSRPAARIRWGAAPNAARFYGRKAELDLLHRWIIGERGRLVALLGIGGIGKTSLAAQYCLYAQPHFEDILWISLRNAPLPGEMLTECIRFFSQQEQDGRSNDPADQIDALIALFRSRRCLLVIDNFESVLVEGKYAGAYRSEYAAYGDLLRQVGASDHQSCVILTGREKPEEVLALEAGDPPARSLVLKGLGPDEARQILSDSGKNLSETPAALDRLVKQVTGSPLVLQWVPALIDLYAGDIDRLLDDGAVIAGDIFPLLQQQFQRLAGLEVDILFWLAVEREAVSLKQFQETLLPAANRTDLVNALLSLQRRSLLESSKDGFLLQNLVMEYVTYLFVNRVAEEIIAGEIRYFNSHALYRVQAREFITQAQRRLIVRPIAQQLLKRYGKRSTIQKSFAHILHQVRQEGPPAPGYAAGNILRLMDHLGIDLTGVDFSHLPLWDLDLRNLPLQQVNFSGCDLSRSAFTELFGRVLCLAFSPDGTLLAAGTTDGEILVVRAEDFSLMLDIHGHTDWVRSLAFDPAGDFLISAGDDSRLRLWDIHTGRCFKTLLGHTGRVMAVVFHPDQPIAASGGEDGTIRLWDVQTGVCERIITGHTQWVYALRFTADGSRLVSASSDQTLKVWDPAGGGCLSTLKGHTGPVWTVALSPDNRLIASSGGDQTIRLWRLDTGEMLRALAPHPSGIRSVSFSPDGRLLAAPSSENIYVYSVETGDLAARLTGHTSATWAALFSPDYRILASAGFDRTLRFWSTQDYQCLFTLRGYHNALPAVAFDPTQPARLVSGCDDGNLRVWDASTGQCLQTLEGHADRVKRVCFSPDGRLLASAGDDGIVRLWDAAGGSVLSTCVVRGAGSMCFDQTGRRLITASSNEDLIRVWDSATGQLAGSLDGQNTEFYWLAVSPDNRVLAAAGEALGQADGKIYLWDLASGERLGQLDGHRETVWALAFDPGGHYLVSAGADRTVRVWDCRLIAGSDAASRDPAALHILQGHTDQVKAVVVSPNGDRFASAGQDGAVRIWDARDFSCAAVLTGHAGAIISLAFSADGQTLCSTGADETLRFWSAETGAPLHICKVALPYQGMNITGVTGISPVQKKKLQDLGAVEGSD